MELSHGQVVTRWCKFKGICSPFTIPARLRICTHNLKNGFVLTDHNRKKSPAGPSKKERNSLRILDSAFLKLEFSMRTVETFSCLMFQTVSSTFPHVED